MERREARRSGGLGARESDGEGRWGARRRRRCGKGGGLETRSRWAERGSGGAEEEGEAHAAEAVRNCIAANVGVAARRGGGSWRRGRGVWWWWWTSGGGEQVGEGEAWSTAGLGVLCRGRVEAGDDASQMIGNPCRHGVDG
jgi:hypothetical protein